MVFCFPGRTKNMADAARGPVIGRPLAFANEERRAVHSWSRISSAGHNVLLDALKILSPMSHDLSSCEDLVNFLQDLSEEGHKPTVLRSKDVYNYRSCTTQPMTEDMLRPPNRNVRPTAKRRGKKPLTKKREVHPSWNTSEKSSPRIQGVRPPELMDHHALICSRTPGRTVEMSQVLQLRPCLKLTSIKGLSGYHTARLQIQTSWDSSSEAPSVAISQQQHPPMLSGIPLQPSQNGGGAPTKAVALFSQKSLSCPLRLDGALIGDSAPVFYANGRAFPETHTELTSNGWRSNGLHRDSRGPKELTRQRNGWKDKNSFRWKVIKVDDSRSVAEARRKAQKILQVNLSPVIQIQPLNHVLRDFRYQNKWLFHPQPYTLFSLADVSVLHPLASTWLSPSVHSRRLTWVFVISAECWRENLWRFWFLTEALGTERHLKLGDAFPSRLGDDYPPNAGTFSLSTLVYDTQCLNQPSFCFGLTGC